MARILVVDDESSIRVTLREFLSDAGYEVDVAADADEALGLLALAAEDYDVVVTDIILPRITGVHLLKSIKEVSPHVQVILMTGEPTIETASAAVREGAFDYLAKPVGKEQLLRSVANAARVKTLEDERLRLEEKNRRHLENLESLVEQRTVALRESEERYRALVEDTPVLICRFCPGGEIAFVNQAYCEYFEKTSEDLVGSSILSLIPTEDRATVMADIATLTAESPTLSHEHPVDAPGGEVRWQRWTNHALFDPEGNLALYQSIGEDITEQKRAEEMARTAENEYLARQEWEREFAETELAKAQGELVEKTRLATLGQRAATISHEIRNPLGTVRIAVHSVEEEVRGQTPQIDRALDRAKRNIQRCDHIVEELLDYTRTKLFYAIPTHIDDWLTDLLDEQHLQDEISVTRSLHASITLDVDREQLRRCVVNLVINACQAMTDLPTDDARLTISTLTEEDRLLIRVNDTGSGIEQDAMDRIFEPLYTTKSSGVGLGLSVVDQLMHQHGGGVLIQSKPGQGTMATLWLPLPVEKES